MNIENKNRKIMERRIVVAEINKPELDLSTTEE
jgi:hypothetical protein